MAVMSKGKVGMLIIITVAILAIIVVIATLPPPHKVELSYSFETDMQDWVPNGLDLDHSPPLNWSIARNDSMASDGNVSLRLYLENWNDKGKIWVERKFEMKANQAYRVTIQFTFATCDFGSVNHWTIIAGALASRPQTVDELSPTYRDKTGNGHDSDIGFVWLEKTYNSDMKAGSDGAIWVVIGVWGTFETPRTYFLDDAQITFTER